jgi:hypothetical protein
LSESQYNSKYNGEENQEDIKRRLTLATPSNCKENSQEDTQTSQQHFQVDVHFLLSTEIKIYSETIYELEVKFNFVSVFFKKLFLEFLLCCGTHKTM